MYRLLGVSSIRPVLASLGMLTTRFWTRPSPPRASEVLKKGGR